jgi:hypothetical protein
VAVKYSNNTTEATAAATTIAVTTTMPTVTTMPYYKSALMSNTVSDFWENEKMMEMTFEVCLAQKHKTIFVNEKLSEREKQRKKA